MVVFEAANLVVGASVTEKLVEGAMWPSASLNQYMLRLEIIDDFELVKMRTPTDRLSRTRR